MAFNVGDRVVFIRPNSHGGRDVGDVGEVADVIRLNGPNNIMVRRKDPERRPDMAEVFCLEDDVTLLEQAPIYSECWLVIYGDRANPANPFRSMLGSRAGADRKILEVRRAGFHVFAAKKIKIQLEV